jgi:hypothetical protein
MEAQIDGNIYTSHYYINGFHVIKPANYFVFSEDNLGKLISVGDVLTVSAVTMSNLAPIGVRAISSNEPKQYMFSELLKT